MANIHIIDTLGVFTEPSDNETINWSKVDFTNLETDSRLDPAVAARITKRFTSYLQTVKPLGYDSLSFDDLAHLVSFTWYSPALKRLIDDYVDLYKALFAIARDHDMKVFVNTDYLFYNDDIHAYMKRTHRTNSEFFSEVLQKAFEVFPEIDGVILRIGENDGKDVKSTFLSKLALHTPQKTNALLRKILPLFEQAGKTLIFRTWTVGVYQIGDLIWNQRTFDTVFSTIKSDALIISMKFGDTDFMRHLSLNPLFQTNTHKKIIELQTRREWEGMGTYPSFVGWDYWQYLQELRHNPTIAGIHVWCQTGGWAKSAWTNLTYLENSSFWNELNTYVTITMWRDQCSPETAINLFCRDHQIHDTAKFIELLRLSEIAIKQGLYIRELAEQRHYFRRSRVPTLLWHTWDRILLQPIAIFLIRTFVRHPKQAIAEADAAVDAVQRMRTLAGELQLPASALTSLEFQLASFTLFAQLRCYILGSNDQLPLKELQAHAATYMQHYPQHYTIPTLTPLKSTSRFIHYSKYPLGLLLRNTSIYRKRDRLLLATSPIQRQLVRYYLRTTKSYLNDQSMGIDVLFK